MKCGEWQRERTPTAKADRARRSVRACCNGHGDAIPTKQKVDRRRWGNSSRQPLRNFCSASFARPAAGAVRAVVMRDPRDVSPLPLGVSPLHIGSEKKFYVPCTHCRRTKLCHTIPLAASTSNSRTQSRPAKRARDGIEWILRVPARPSRHPSVCARAESMTFRLLFVWPYKSSTPGRLLRLSLPCTLSHRSLL